MTETALERASFQAGLNAACNILRDMAADSVFQAAKGGDALDAAADAIAQTFDELFTELPKPTE